jgi:tetratricopeptide (TPR) repeat protein
VGSARRRQRWVVEYTREIQYGDEYMLAAASGAAPRELKRLFDRGVSAYKNAIKARPDQAEPHYRLATAIWTFRLACKEVTSLCTQGRFEAESAAEVVHHWHEFSRLAPLDPRSTDLLFERAILHTKLAGVRDLKKNLELAAADYEAHIDRTESSQIRVPIFASNEIARNNLAETYMMLGRLDDAISMYRLTIQRQGGGGGTSTVYGLAVALDRDEQKTQARALIHAVGDAQFEEFKQEVESGGTFFVPDGEKHYYMALAHEALGRPQQAIAEYDRFIKSGAHPQYQARARANRTALANRRDKQPKPTPTMPPEKIRIHQLP